MSKWHKGPPPSVGWWPASVRGMEGIYRWWDGRRWSAPVMSQEPADFAGHAATIKKPGQKDVQWQHRPANWPERSKT